MSFNSKADEIDVLPPYEQNDTSLLATTTQQKTTDLKDALMKEEAPTYTQSTRSAQKPVVVPQVSDNPKAVFLPAYAPSLLSYGIPQESWAVLLTTLSALLAATSTEQAVNHAGDIAKRVGNVPAQYGKNVASHAKSLGRNIAYCAKRGNVVGAAAGTIGGGIGLTFATTFGAVGALFSLPGASIGAVARKPQTPRQRATAYLDIANRDWFAPRRLCAQLMDTQELSRLLGVSSTQLLENSMTGRGADADTQLQMLRPYVAELTLGNSEGLKLGQQTLWLVVTNAETLRR